MRGLHLTDGHGRSLVGKSTGVVLDFLDLPDWEPEASELTLEKRHEGDYERGMDPATRGRLEEYFEPHNRRLYEFLGKDLGW